MRKVGCRAESFDEWATRLLASGRTVARVEQMEDAAKASGKSGAVIRREVLRNLGRGVGSRPHEERTLQLFHHHRRSSRWKRSTRRERGRRTIGTHRHRFGVTTRFVHRARARRTERSRDFRDARDDARKCW